MRKVLLIMFATIATACVCSCSDGLESKAKEQMEKTMRELAKNPDALKIEDVKTILNNDSVTVLSFRTHGQNGFGGYSTSKLEYCYVKNNKRDGSVEYHECIVDLDDIEDEEQPHPVSIKSLLKEYKNSKDEKFLKLCKEKNLTPEEGAKDLAYSFARINCMMWGREVEDE